MRYCDGMKLRHERQRVPSYKALCKEAGVGHVDEMSMHGDVFGKLDELRVLLYRCAGKLKKVVTINRMYLNGDTISLNIAIEGERYLILVSDNGYEVWKSDKKTSQIKKHLIQYTDIEDGSFLELFVK